MSLMNSSTSLASMALGTPFSKFGPVRDSIDRQAAWPIVLPRVWMNVDQLFNAVGRNPTHLGLKGARNVHLVRRALTTPCPSLLVQLVEVGFLGDELFVFQGDELGHHVLGLACAVWRRLIAQLIGDPFILPAERHHLFQARS